MNGRPSSLLVMLAALALAGCRGERAPEATDLAQDISLPEARVELGRTVPGGYVGGVLKVRAERDATITRAEGSCGCTLVTASVPLKVSAGEVVEIPVALDLSRLANGGANPDRPGPIEREVVVTTQRGARLTAMLVADLSDRVRIDLNKRTADILIPKEEFDARRAYVEGVAQRAAVLEGV